MRLPQPQWKDPCSWFMTIAVWVFALNQTLSEFGLHNAVKNLGDEAQMIQQAEHVGINEGLPTSSMLEK